MPRKIEVKKYWGPMLVKLKKFDSLHEVMEADYCFACGMMGSIDLAHIRPRCENKSDHVSQIHCLCRTCHLDSEFLEGRQYWKWFLRRDPLKMLISSAMRNSPRMRQVVTSRFFQL